MTSHRSISIAELGALLDNRDEPERWRRVTAFIEEYRREPREFRRKLLCDEPEATGDRRWDVLLAALAEHLCAADEQRGPQWCEKRCLERFWFPFNSAAARAEAIVHAPAAFRRRGVFVARHGLDVVPTQESDGHAARDADVMALRSMEVS